MSNSIYNQKDIYKENGSKQIDRSDISEKSKEDFVNIVNEVEEKWWLTEIEKPFEGMIYWIDFNQIRLDLQNGTNLLYKIFEHKLSENQVDELKDSLNYSLIELWRLKKQSTTAEGIKKIDKAISEYKYMLENVRMAKDMISNWEYLSMEKEQSPAFSLNDTYIPMSAVNQLTPYVWKKIIITKLEIDWKNVNDIKNTNKEEWDIKIYIKDLETWTNIDPLTHWSQYSGLWKVYNK